jgi:tight adherence protein C
MIPDRPGAIVGAALAAAVLGVAHRRSAPRLRTAQRLAGLGVAVGEVKPSGTVRSRRRWSRLLVVAFVALVATAFHPAAALLVLAGAARWPARRRQRASRAAADAVRRELPETVDLLLVAVASGLNLVLAVAAVGARGPPRLGAAFRRAAADVDAGARLADALDAALTPLGDVVRPLSAALIGAARYGTEIGSALDRLAFESRQARRRHAEETVRRVPVKLLFPLVLLILPAFALLTVAPLLAEAFRSLRL